MPSKKKYVPNSVLPKGATMLRRVVAKKIAGWVEMNFDAKVQRLGLTWWRIVGGFGGPTNNHPSEDWVADLPTGCLSVSNEDWDGSAPFGYSQSKPLYRSFDAAVVGETIQFMGRCERSAQTARAEAEATEATVKTVRAAIERATKSKKNP